MIAGTKKLLDLPILPPATIGILGSGQLGRMMSHAAKQMGYTVHIFSPGTNTPAGQVSDREFTAAYTDLDAVRQFAETCDVVTYEFENVPAETAEAVTSVTLLAPGSHVLAVAQDRIVEKTMLSGVGLPVTPFRPVRNEDELRLALAELGAPSVLKTARDGYDGKGQVKIPPLNPPQRGGERNSPSVREGLGEGVFQQGMAAWDKLNRVPCVLEAFVPFACEVSVVAARGWDTKFVPFGVIENEHRNHILDVSIAPARVSGLVVNRAIHAAEQVMHSLEAVGVLCVEFFVTADEHVLINEIAPRPHNSGHLTIEACPTSQFEQSIRAICGLPLGKTTWRKPTVMINLLGDLWQNRSPDWTIPLARPDTHLHLYGKAEPRPGRKMGHITVSADTVENAYKISKECLVISR